MGKILILECYSHIFYKDNNGTLAQLSSYFIHFNVLGPSDWHAVLSPKFDELEICMDGLDKGLNNKGVCFSIPTIIFS